MSCVVVIPVYKDVPSVSERASIRQTFRVLGKHDIVFVTHEGCQLDEYRKIVEGEHGTLRTEFFDKGYFDSTAHYSDLCFSEVFYLRFKDHDYMLICQTDAWVFRDELDWWCSQNYDYIGAPIYFPYNKKRFTRIFFGIGNGGFCLRKISHCLKVVRHNRKKTFLKPRALIRMYWYYFLYNEAFTSNILKRLALVGKVVAKCFGISNTTGYFIQNHINEDMLFGTWAAQSWGLADCRIPDELTAACFSMEVNAPILYNQLGDKLPFGCHAFEKWNYLDFWKEHITLE